MAVNGNLAMTSCRRCPGGWSEIVYRALGRDVGYYALAQAAVIGAFAGVWFTARSMVGPVLALLAVLIIDGLHYFQYTAAKFNHDVIQLPIWAWAGYFFHAALRRRQLVCAGRCSASCSAWRSGRNIS